MSQTINGMVYIASPQCKGLSHANTSVDYLTSEQLTIPFKATPLIHPPHPASSGHTDTASEAVDRTPQDASQGQVVPAWADPGGAKTQEAPAAPQGVQTQCLPQPPHRPQTQAPYSVCLPVQLQEQASQEAQGKGKVKGQIREFFFTCFSGLIDCFCVCVCVCVCSL